MAKYASSSPARPKMWRRIWCMGILQSLCGTLIVGSLAVGILALWSHMHH